MIENENHSQLELISDELIALMTDSEKEAYQKLLEEELYTRTPAEFGAHVGGLRGDPFIIYKHVAFLDKYLMKVYNGEIRKLMIFEPPRHGKSEHTTKYFPAWWLKKRPRDEIIIATYGAEFSEEWGEKTREVYRAFPYGVPLGKRQANAHWQTAQGGALRTAGVDGGITGRGGNLFVIDDPIKNAVEAKSEIMRARAKEFYTTVARTRLQPSKTSGLPGAIILIQTRWHEDDLGGWLLETEGEFSKTNPDGWVVVRMPALAIEGDVLGRKPGEALCPERYSVEELESIRVSSDAYWWNCMFQQDPIPAEGTIIPVMSFPRYMTRFVDDIEYYQLGHELIRVDSCYRFASTDLAATERTTADWTVGCLWDMTQPLADGLRRLVLRDVRRVRIDTTKHLQFVLDLIADGARFVGVEKKTYGLNLVQNAKRRGVPVRPVEADTDKISRALEAVELMERCYLPADSEGKGEWMTVLLAELGAFPNGRHDDQVDAWAYGLRVLAQYNQYVKKRDEKQKPLEDPLSERARLMLERLSRPKKRKHPVLGKY